MKQFDLEKFKQLKTSTEIEYKKIVSVNCPALQGEVIFNSDGFHHLQFDGTRAERHKKTQETKFLLLNKAVDVIKKTTTIQEYRRGLCPIGKEDRSGFRKTKMVQWFSFIAIVSATKGIRIRAIVRKVGDGPHHFWSVMPLWGISKGFRVVGSIDLEDK